MHGHNWPSFAEVAGCEYHQYTCNKTIQAQLKPKAISHMTPTFCNGKTLSDHPSLSTPVYCRKIIHHNNAMPCFCLSCGTSQLLTIALGDTSNCSQLDRFLLTYCSQVPLFHANNNYCMCECMSCKPFTVSIKKCTLLYCLSIV